MRPVRGVSALAVDDLWLHFRLCDAVPQAKAAETDLGGERLGKPNVGGAPPPASDP